MKAFQQKACAVLLWENAGLSAAVGEEDHLSQLVEKLDGSSRQLGQTPDGCSVNLLMEFKHIQHFGLEKPDAQFWAAWIIKVWAFTWRVSLLLTCCRPLKTLCPPKRDKNVFLKKEEWSGRGYTSTESAFFTSSSLSSSCGLIMSVIWLQVLLQACRVRDHTINTNATTELDTVISNSRADQG